MVHSKQVISASPVLGEALSEEAYLQCDSTSANLVGSDEDNPLSHTEDLEDRSTTCAGNCIVSSVLLAYVCTRGCDTRKIAAEFAFFPPTPPTYRLEFENGKVRSLVYNYSELSDDPTCSSLSNLTERGIECMILDTANNLKTCAFYFPADEGLKDNHKGNPLIIYAHGNATDCGVMLPIYMKLCRRTGVAVLALEYSGYGESTGTPSARSTNWNIEAAYVKALAMGHTRDDIILLGQSIGSAPVCHLAAQHQVRGVILHSPIASGLRTLSDTGCCSPACIFHYFEPFDNMRLIKKVRSPVFIIHGTDDEEVPQMHGRMLLERSAVRYEPYWVSGAGHSDVVEKDPEEYFRRIAEFIDESWSRGTEQL